MVTQNPHEPAPGAQVENEPHRHAFVLVGENQLFGVHMTQYHCELHKYQIILKLKLPNEPDTPGAPTIYTEYLKLRELYPDDTFVLCNAKNPEHGVPYPDNREYCIPDLGSGRITEFTANIFQGFRPISKEQEAKDVHYFPWDEQYCNPVLGEFTVQVERIVLFRPFDHLEVLPTYARYFLFGDGDSDECHMTNLQTASLITSAFEPPVFGPDYDHVLSLASRPDWLEQDALLEAGVIVTTPVVRLVDPETDLPTIPAEAPFAEDEKVEVLYRGMLPVRSVIAAKTYSYCTPVCNSPRFFMPKPEQDSYLQSLPQVPIAFEFSIMPKRYWVFPDSNNSSTVSPEEH